MGLAKQGISKSRGYLATDCAKEKERSVGFFEKKVMSRSEEPRLNHEKRTEFNRLAPRLLLRLSWEERQLVETKGSGRKS